LELKFFDGLKFSVNWHGTDFFLQSFNIFLLGTKNSSEQLRLRESEGDLEPNRCGVSGTWGRVGGGVGVAVLKPGPGSADLTFFQRP